MFITHVKFKGFQRFIHNNIQELSVDFTSPFQLILGTNGCGKSSMMTELTPFPPHKGLFDKDGMRELEFTHRASSYRIVNDYSTDKHSIYKDDEEMFTNLNPTMMAGVVKQLFNIDRTIADILTDKKRFTDMSTNERREIIMRASGININIGLDILSNLKEQKSYYKEYTKNLSKRLVTEENNIPSDSHIEALNARKEDILHDLLVLDEISNQKVEVSNEWEMLDRVKRVETLGKTIAYSFLDTPDELQGIRDGIDAQEILALAKFNLNASQESKQRLHETMENLKLSLGKSTFSATEEELKKEQAKLAEDIEQIRKDSHGFLMEDGDVSYAMISAQELYETLRDIFTRLPDNSNRYFNKEKRDENAERIIALNNKLGLYQKSILGLEHELNLHMNGDLIACPACTFEFIPGTRLSKSEISQSLKASNEAYAKVNAELTLEKEYEVEIRDYQNLVLELEKTLRHFSQQQTLINALKDYNYINNPPAYCLNIIEQWYTDIKASPQLNTLNKRLNKVNEELAHLALEDWEKKKADEDQLQQLSHQYSQLLDDVFKREETIERIQSYIKHVAKLREWLEDANRLEAEITEYHEKTLINMVNQFVLHSKADLNNELGKIEKEITNITYLKFNRDKLIADKETAEQAVEDINILQDELSPKTGLLGEVMDEFILKFITQMNNIIKSVWTYSMEILPCRNKKGDLDFYFPVKVMDGTKSDDVANLSSSQRDIINHAFKRLIMLTHDLEDFPLFNDELSNTMDDTHRIRAMKMIYDAVVNNQCSQMFFISHFAPQHGVFTQAEVLVINPDNLQTIPDNYNAHAKII